MTHNCYLNTRECPKTQMLTNMSNKVVLGIIT